MNVLSIKSVLKIDVFLWCFPFTESHVKFVFFNVKLPKVGIMLNRPISNLTIKINKSPNTSAFD